MEKMTKRELYAAIIDAFKTGETKVSPETIVKFCEDEIALLEKRALKAKERAAAKAAEADPLLEQTKAALTDEFKTIPEIAAVVGAENPDATTSKVTNRLSRLVDAGVAEKTQVTIPATENAKARKAVAYKLV